MGIRLLKRYQVGLVLLVAVCLSLECAPRLVATAIAGQEPHSNGPYYVRSYLGKCLAYGAPGLPVAGANVAAVFVYDCERDLRPPRVRPAGVQQLVRVQELADPAPVFGGRATAGVVSPFPNPPPFPTTHRIVLHAGSKVIGVARNFLVNGAPLELQDENLSAGQIFRFDGDSIILAADHDLVIQVKDSHGSNLTPLILGNRDLADSEFWNFSAADGSNAKPTTGFWSVAEESDLLTALKTAGLGTVIEVDPNAVIVLNDQKRLEIPAGVTLRGDRRGLRLGPILARSEISNDPAFVDAMLEINGSDDVRIAGLRLQGPSDDPKVKIGNIRGVHIDHRPKDKSGPHVIIDHNNISMWTTAGVEVDGGDAGTCLAGYSCTCPAPDMLRQHNTRIERNFIDLNRNDPGSGYGVVVSNGGYPSIKANTFMLNRHSIAADGTTLDGYSAFFNLVQSAAANDPPQQDVDMHGLGNNLCGRHEGHIGLYSGSDVEIARNTFLGTNRSIFELRGQACALDSFHDNVVLKDRNSAIHWFSHDGCEHNGDDDGTSRNWLEVPNDQFSKPDPTSHLYVVAISGGRVAGRVDFDGDGREDLFLATGQAWYYSPAGAAEWRFLSGKTEKTDVLLFGDFDGDGRTDVFTQQGRDWLASWGGVSPWRKINASDARMSDFAIGDFNGDGRADVFYANGNEWFVSSGGVGPFVHYAFQSQRVPDLRFGDFNGDGKTDVFGVVGLNWSVVYGGTDHWKPLRPKLSDSVAALVVADFTGNGRADVATSKFIPRYVYDWQVSVDGMGDWESLNNFTIPLAAVAAIGNFDNNPGADVLIREGNSLYVMSSGRGSPQPYSRQDMR